MFRPGKLLKYGLILLLLGLVAGVLTAVVGYYHFRKDLPPIDNLRHVQLQVPLRVYSADGKLIAQYGEKRRYPVRYEEIPPLLVKAFLAAEDQNFFRHRGIDPVGLARAAITLLTTGEKRQGGSTITMQVARNFYLTRQRTFTRKIREIILALHIEQALSKEEILELYLNKIYLGHRAYGIKAAAEVYYGKSLDELTLPEMAMIAGLPKAPSRYNPVTDPERALQRRNYVLRRMAETGAITPEQAREAMKAPVTASLHGAEIEVEAPYLAEMVREKMVRDYGEAAYTGGFEVVTTVDARLQEAANRALRKALVEYDRRHGWRGPEGHLDAVPESAEARQALLKKHPPVGDLLPALVVEVKEREALVEVRGHGLVTLPWKGIAWARPYQTVNRRGPAPKKAADVLEKGDLVRVQRWVDDPGTKKKRKKGKAPEPEPYWRLAQVPEVSGALVALNPRDGAIVALVGGYDFYASKFNRVTQARRQPGSGFKAVIYSAALEAGFTPASIINDAPVVIEDDGSGDSWRPENYSGRFFGPTRLRMALTKSRNLVSIRLLRSMGIEHALEHARRFGFDPDQLPHGLSLALGSGEVTPLQMARAYAVLANGGYLVEPWFIRRIDRAGETIYRADPLVAGCEPGSDPPCRPAPRTLSEENRYIMYSMMQDVITRGTGWRARALGRKDLAGKTGTTNDQRDAWFNGYNQHLVAVAWVGFDDNRTLGRKEVGGRVALPAWMTFMKEALEGVPDEPPEMPESLVVARIDRKTGLRVTGNRPDTLLEVFMPGTEPPLLEERRGAEPFAADSGEGGGIDELF